MVRKAVYTGVGLAFAGAAALSAKLISDWTMSADEYLEAKGFSPKLLDDPALAEKNIYVTEFPSNAKFLGSSSAAEGFEQFSWSMNGGIKILGLNIRGTDWVVMNGSAVDSALNQEPFYESGETRISQGEYVFAHEICHTIHTEQIADDPKANAAYGEAIADQCAADLLKKAYDLPEEFNKSVMTDIFVDKLLAIIVQQAVGNQENVENIKNLPHFNILMQYALIKGQKLPTYEEMQNANEKLIDMFTAEFKQGKGSKLNIYDMAANILRRPEYKDLKTQEPDVHGILKMMAEMKHRPEIPPELEPFIRGLTP